MYAHFQTYSLFYTMNAISSTDENSTISAHKKFEQTRTVLTRLPEPLRKPNL